MQVGDEDALDVAQRDAGIHQAQAGSVTGVEQIGIVVHHQHGGLRQALGLQ
ncbi:hypothetical protein D3C80_1934760 [compost metagenome]